MLAGAVGFEPTRMLWTHLLTVLKTADIPLVETPRFVAHPRVELDSLG